MTQVTRKIGDKVYIAGYGGSRDSFYLGEVIKVTPKGNVTVKFGAGDAEKRFTSYGSEIGGDKRAQKKLGRLQRQEARRRKNHSKRHAKSKLAVARLHARIKNVRNDFIHKFTTDLAKHHSEIIRKQIHS